LRRHSSQNLIGEIVMRIVVRPAMEPQREIDVTQRLIAVIAEELWRTCGGNEQLNWIEAETHLRQIVGETTIEAHLYAMQCNSLAPSQTKRGFNVTIDYQDGASDNGNEEQRLPRERGQGAGVGQRRQGSAREPRPSVRRRCS
jgi:hypothetical protein